jgi:DNA replication protein DnaC
MKTINNCLPDTAGQVATGAVIDLLRCPVCGEARQTVINFNGTECKVRCICHCEEQKIKKEEERLLRREKLIRIEQMKAHGLQDPSLREYTFAHDSGDNPLMSKARKYVQKWDEFKAEDIGLLLFGNVGTGKSFFAGCIANALLDQGIPVLMTSFPKILNTLGTLYSDERNTYISSLNEYDLLIIDDLGSERETDYALEQIYSVIDARYRSRKPLIITTNLSLQEMKNYAYGNDLRYARIYDRVLEKCQPIAFTGKNYRRSNAKDAYRKAARLLWE